MDSKSSTPVYLLTPNQRLEYRKILSSLCDEIAVYGTSPISQMLNPHVENAVSKSWEDVNRKVLRAKCLKALALYWLIYQDEPEYFNFLAANNVPRALKSAGYKGNEYALGNDRQNPDSELIPYIEEFLAINK